ncbi:enoyl-CoA hydratase/isomerase family protein [Quisquiliibacterium transsilvanicum]|uniref:Enoyl-CoA hydratase n=1 Tax=Quisquiliibacterium transsilvanicum TaxID=1549638 RepID=A0A7W8M7T9_9BURK|nr:enoyl-CoA hydratase/isomerase family protein [Quisquiliibacterium transsilvanicum]MBB5270927.1 enoyl-CoA hydratase [Quisquiliibacterium transsilvanicum]
MDYKTLKIDREGGVEWLTLNRPDNMNTLDPVMKDELWHYFDRLYTDRSVRVVVMRGAGRMFCAGLDLTQTSVSDRKPGERISPDDGMVSQRKVSEIVIRMRRCPQPIIALVHGAAAGGGFAMALAADIRIAAEGTKMNAAFIKLGLSACDMGVSYFLPRLVGVSVASELMLTGRFIHADRALATGLVSEVVPKDKLEETARGYVADMLRTSPLGLKLTKDCLNHAVDAGSLEAAIAIEDRNQILCVQSPNFVEGVAAFLEKREPRYT